VRRRGAALVGGQADRPGRVHRQGARFEATVGPGGVAGFRLEPSATTANVAKLAAVGFTATGTPRGFVLDDAGFSVDALLGTVRRYTLAEQTILQAQGPQRGGDPTDQIIVWRAPNAEATTPSCLAIEHRDGTNEFLVPPGDPDSDGFIANECDPDWYDYAASQETCQALTKVVLSAASSCNTGFVSLSSATVMVSSQLDFNSASVQGRLQLDPVTHSSPCTFTLTPAFKVLVEPPLSTVGGGVLALATSNGSTLLVPVIVNFMSVAACSSPADAIQCTLVNTSADTIYTCAH
jgi:hypothetical protein